MRLTTRILEGIIAATSLADAGGPEDMGLRDDKEGRRLHDAARDGLSWATGEKARRERAQAHRRRAPPAPRTCEGCGRTGGTTPIARHSYWHPACWRKATPEERDAVARNQP